MLFKADTTVAREKVNGYIRRNIKAPHVASTVSTLGGITRASVIIQISLDPKRSWHNAIYQNSRYAMFHLGIDGVLELFQKSYRISGKMRKIRVKTIAEAVAKINQYIKQNK